MKKMRRKNAKIVVNIDCTMLASSMLTVYCGASFSNFPDLFTYMKLMKTQVGVTITTVSYINLITL